MYSFQFECVFIVVRTLSVGGIPFYGASATRRREFRLPQRRRGRIPLLNTDRKVHTRRVYSNGTRAQVRTRVQALHTRVALKCVTVTGVVWAEGYVTQSVRHCRWGFPLRAGPKVT